jgi:hypothetical protein
MKTHTPQLLIKSETQQQLQPSLHNHSYVDMHAHGCQSMQ